MVSPFQHLGEASLRNLIDELKVTPRSVSVLGKINSWVRTIVQLYIPDTSRGPRSVSPPDRRRPDRHGETRDLYPLAATGNLRSEVAELGQLYEGLR